MVDKSSVYDIEGSIYYGIGIVGDGAGGDGAGGGLARM